LLKSLIAFIIALAITCGIGELSGTLYFGIDNFDFIYLIGYSIIPLMFGMLVFKIDTYKDSTLKAKSDEKYLISDKPSLEELVNAKYKNNNKLTIHIFKFIVMACAAFALIAIGIFFVSKSFNLSRLNYSNKVSFKITNQTTTVYYVSSGDKYHSNFNCPSLKNSKRIKSGDLYYCESHGLEPCQICWDLD
jgi:hypothetical protein